METLLSEEKKEEDQVPGVTMMRPRACFTTFTTHFY